MISILLKIKNKRKKKATERSLEEDGNFWVIRLWFHLLPFLIICNLNFIYTEVYSFCNK